jgi:cobalt/nickel transport system permease protein
MLPLDLTSRYQRAQSLVHTLDPRVKIVGALLLIVVASALPDGAWLGYGLLFGLALLAAHLSGLGWSYAWRRAFIVLPFTLAAITLPFTLRGTVIAQFAGLTVSLEGLVRFVSIVVKSWVSVQTAILLAATTSFPDLLWGLRALRLPRVLVSTIGFMYRYLYVLSDEAGRLLRARAARSATGPGRSGGSLAWRGKVAGGMVGNLALRSIERSEFQGELRVLAAPQLGRRDWLALLGWCVAVILVLLLGWFGERW